MPTFTSTMTDDAYHRASDLFGVRGAIIEGSIEAQTNGLTYRYGDEAAPETGAGGSAIAAGSGRGLGPVRSPEAAWRLDRLWVRNTAAGSNGVFVVVAQVMAA